MHLLKSQIGRPRIACTLVFLSLASPAWSEVTGRVLSVEGIPVENARVAAPSG